MYGCTGSQIPIKMSCFSEAMHNHQHTQTKHFLSVISSAFDNPVCWLIGLSKYDGIQVTDRGESTQNISK